MSTAETTPPCSLRADAARYIDWLGYHGADEEDELLLRQIVERREQKVARWLEQEQLAQAVVDAPDACSLLAAWDRLKAVV